MRLFAGIEFSSETKRELAHIIDRLKIQCSSGRWEREDNFHLTLKFLGEVPAEQLPAVSKALENAARGCGRFSLQPGGLGCFNRRREGTDGENIRVLWIGLHGDTDRLGILKDRVEENFISAGFERDTRRFSPHVTLAREVTANAAFNDLKDKVLAAAIPPVEVNDIVLFKSELVSGKRVYTPVRRFALD